MIFVADRRHYPALPTRDSETLQRTAALNRIHALACIQSARHGWLGASFSAAEILTTLYAGLGEERIVLSKGHAAAMQYACLYGQGRLDAAALRSYKNGPEGLQAHTARGTPGILTTTGSLGQSLSKVAGLALCAPERRFFVVLGDGELQEGQNYEALQTLHQLALANVTVIVDANGFQTEAPVGQIKAIPELCALFAAFGLDVAEVDGHDPAQLLEVLGPRPERPLVVVARTVKAAGSALLAPRDGKQPWHGRVPDDELYAALVLELAEAAGSPGLVDEARGALTSGEMPPPAAGRGEGPSTRDGFATALLEEARVNDRVSVLDADLAAACGLSEVARLGPPRFLEMGIAEQDMVSLAGGLALGGRVPVVNTYAAFLARACEQIRVNLAEGARVVYAGHYAGLCYFTDGRTHQSLADLAMARSLLGLQVAEPTLPEQAGGLLRWALHDAPGSVYLRLRRTAQDLRPLAGAYDPADPTAPLVLGEPAPDLLVSCGPVSTRLALDCLEDPAFTGFGLLVPSLLEIGPHAERYERLLPAARRIVVIEEDVAPGTVTSLITTWARRLGLRPVVLRHGLERWGGSFRSLSACLAHFGFEVAAVRQRLADLP